MFDIKVWVEYVVEWVVKDFYGFFIIVILVFILLFLVSVVLFWKLVKMIEVREKE